MTTAQQDSRTKAALAFAEAAWRRLQAERELARVRHAPQLWAPALDALCRAIADEHEPERAHA